MYILALSSWPYSLWRGPGHVTMVGTTSVGIIIPSGAWKEFVGTLYRCVLLHVYNNIIVWSHCNMKTSGWYNLSSGIQEWFICGTLAGERCFNYCGYFFIIFLLWLVYIPCLPCASQTSHRRACQLFRLKSRLRTSVLWKWDLKCKRGPLKPCLLSLMPCNLGM